MLYRGELVPHFTVTRLNGSRVSYGDIWQRKNLLFVRLPADESSERAAYVAELDDRSDEFTALDTECVVTADSVLDLRPPAVLIADRWGEIQFIGNGVQIADLPTIEGIIEWLRFIEHQCPECEGESR